MTLFLTHLSHAAGDVAMLPLRLSDLVLELTNSSGEMCFIIEMLAHCNK